MTWQQGPVPTANATSSERLERHPHIAVQGAFMAALYAQGLPWEQMHQLVREYAAKMSSIKHLFTDLTLPIMSIFSGKGFDDIIRETSQHGPQQIEDLWLR